jgi:hypothetical protein
MDRLFISFSGGETSGMMTHLLHTVWRGRYSEVVIVFANTGQENEETLEFVRDFDRHFGVKTIWVEAVVHHEKGEGTKHKIVDFETANRNGAPFEDIIKKFGIPNAKYPQCTRELKQRPLTSYLRSIGWTHGTYHTAIGIRQDEAHRRSPNALVNGLVYPLLDWRPTTKPMVNVFWREQPFRLRLMGYQGNCRWCWKKSLRKHLTIIDDDPAIYDFPSRMEKIYGLVGPEFGKEFIPGYRRTFFRQNLSAADLLKIYEQQKDTFDRAEDDAVLYEHQMYLFDDEPGDGCTEHCEVIWDDAAA